MTKKDGGDEREGVGVGGNGKGWRERESQRAAQVRQRCELGGEDASNKRRSKPYIDKDKRKSWNETEREERREETERERRRGREAGEVDGARGWMDERRDLWRVGGSEGHSDRRVGQADRDTEMIRPGGDRNI